MYVGTELGTYFCFNIHKYSVVRVQFSKDPLVKKKNKNKFIICRIKSKFDTIFLY